MSLRRAFLLLALSLLIAVLSGCGAETRTDRESQREQVSESHTVTKEVTVHTPTADGGFIVEKTTTTDTTAGERSKTVGQESQRTAPDAATRALIATGGRLAGQVVNAATGGTGGGLVELGVTAAISALLSAYGGAKHAQARQLREERDFHKDDAEKGWQRAMARTDARDGGAHGPA
jgi:hypothetical protein